MHGFKTVSEIASENRFCRRAATALPPQFSSKRSRIFRQSDFVLRLRARRTNKADAASQRRFKRHRAQCPTLRSVCLHKVIAIGFNTIVTRRQMR